MYVYKLSIDYYKKIHHKVCIFIEFTGYNILLLQLVTLI